MTLLTVSLVLLGQSPASASTFSVDDANAAGVQNIAITSSPSIARGDGSAGNPLVYPTSVSIGVNVSWTFTLPATVTNCAIYGGATVLHPYGNFTTSRSVNTCTLTGSTTADTSEGSLVIRVQWGSSDAIFHVKFEKQYDHGSQQHQTSATINTTNGFAIGSTVSINAATVWKNSYLNTLGASSFSYFAFISNGKCGQSSNGSSRIYLANNNDFNWSGNGFQIPQSATTSTNVFIPDLTGYGLTLITSYNGNNTIMNQLTSYKIGETSLVACTHTYQGGGGMPGGPGGSSVRPSGPKYEGPEILAVDTFRPIIAGGKLTFTGKNLSAVTSATIGSKAASLSFDATSGLSIGTPAGLAPGKYDLVMESSYGKLTHINAVTIKAPTPTVTIGFRSDDAYLDEKQVLDLVAFNQTLNPDYEKVRCIVNASDPKVAKRIADLVCAQVARGEARNVEVIKDIRNTYPGEGFWVRVYAAG